MFKTTPSPLKFDSDWTDIELKFAVYDKDNSGYLDAGELMQLMADLGHAGNSDRSQRLINKCAAAPGGKLSFLDFWLAHTGSSLPPTYSGRYTFLLVRTY
jgi:Ca2+-binding EF-hand superfamily protein